MDPWMPDWVKDLRDTDFFGEYGSYFAEWEDSRGDQDIKIAVGQVVLEFLGSDDWRKHPKKIRNAVETTLERQEEEFESWLMETYPQGVNT
jgi:hypothetical protein